jgi:hypothetical protein
MNSPKEYRLLENKYLERLLEELNEHGSDGWSIALYIQEYGVTKVILERETN